MKGGQKKYYCRVQAKKYVGCQKRLRWRLRWLCEDGGKQTTAPEKSEYEHV